MIQEVVLNRPDLLRAGGIEVACWARHKQSRKTQRLAFWKRQADQSFLRYEGFGGQSDPANGTPGAIPPSLNG